MKKAVFLGLAALATSGCATLSPRSGCDCSDPRAAWTALLSTVGQLAEAGRFDAVDSTLVAYAAARVGTQEAHEVVFWRALYKLDPRNPSPQAVAAMQLLDDYMLSGAVHWYRPEARVVRELAFVQASAGQPINAQQPAGPAMPGTPPRPITSAEKDIEIQQLRERNARLEAELERIRRRLSTP